MKNISLQFSLGVIIGITLLALLIGGAGKVSHAGDQKGEPMSGYSKSGFDVTPLTKEQIATLAKKLTPDEARIILNQGTEQAFCGNLLDNKTDGQYTCRLCELPLFASSAKFTSGTGWPSFFQPVETRVKLVELSPSMFSRCHRAPAAGELWPRPRASHCSTPMAWASSLRHGATS